MTQQAPHPTPLLFDQPLQPKVRAISFSFCLFLRNICSHFRFFLFFLFFLFFFSFLKLPLPTTETEGRKRTTSGTHSGPSDKALAAAEKAAAAQAAAERVAAERAAHAAAAMAAQAAASGGLLEPNIEFNALDFYKLIINVQQVWKEKRGEWRR